MYISKDNQLTFDFLSVLSDKDLRKRYDQLGKDQAVPDAGFEDPSELITSIFGGEAFADLYVLNHCFFILGDLVSIECYF